MARTDVIVLGAGIVGTAAALSLARRGRKVALIDRRAPGLETSYGNAGILEGNLVLPHAFPPGFGAILRVALKRATEANYHLGFLPRVASWLTTFRAYSRPEALLETATLIRPMMAQSVAEHEALAADAGASHLIARRGWLRIYRTDAGLAENAYEREVAARFGVVARVLDSAALHALEPSLSPVAKHGVFWQDAGSVDDPLALTRAYADRLRALGGTLVIADARTLRRADNRWRVLTADGALDADEAVVALGPWAPDVLRPLGIRLPLAVKRGYHLHYRARDGAGLSRPILDAECGYCLAPMAQGIRLTTGAEFAARDARATPVQIGRVLPHARALFPLGEPVEATPWMGSRPCFYDSRPVIGRAPGQPGLWLAIGHGHLGLTLAAVSGRLLAEMMTGATPVVDPGPYAAERFSR